MPRKKIQPEKTEETTQEAVEQPKGNLSCSAFQVPEGYKLVPQDAQVVPGDYIAIPRSVYEDLKTNHHTTTVVDTRKKEDGKPQFYLVKCKAHLGDARVTLLPGDVVEYYPRRKFIYNGKPQEKLGSFTTLINAQKRGGKQYFEIIKNPEDLTTDEWGEFHLNEEDQGAKPDPSTSERRRVAKEERADATKAMTNKEKIAMIGKTNMYVETGPQPSEPELPPRGSQARKDMIRRRGMANVDTLKGEKIERISDIKIQNTSRDSRVVGRVPGQSALDTSVKHNPSLHG